MTLATCNSWMFRISFQPVLFLGFTLCNAADVASVWPQDNGYELLFLSARAISQAYLTRQFLFNVKQVHYCLV